MKNKFLLSLLVASLACAGLFLTTFYFYAKNASVSEQFNGDSGRDKVNTSKNDLMLWESLSSHLLSLN